MDGMPEGTESLTPPESEPVDDSVTQATEPEPEPNPEPPKAVDTSTPSVDREPNPNPEPNPELNPEPPKAVDSSTRPADPAAEPVSENHVHVATVHSRPYEGDDRLSSSIFKVQARVTAFEYNAEIQKFFYVIKCVDANHKHWIVRHRY